MGCPAVPPYTHTPLKSTFRTSLSLLSCWASSGFCSGTQLGRQHVCVMSVRTGPARSRWESWLMGRWSVPIMVSCLPESVYLVVSLLFFCADRQA
jgi:hypothetical protein